jgi:hypothetical protein
MKEVLIDVPDSRRAVYRAGVKHLTCLLLAILMTGTAGQLTAGAAGQTPSPATDRADVIAAVQGFFDSMARRDAALAARVFMPAARLYAVTEGPTRTVRVSTVEEFISGLTTGTGALLERMWDPEVRVHGGIATLWTRYDFHRAGVFSHCGVDAFDLVKTADGWKIAGASYTIERTGCTPSPLGPPRASGVSP